MPLKLAALVFATLFVFPAEASTSPVDGVLRSCLESGMSRETDAALKHLILDALNSRENIISYKDSFFVENNVVISRPTASSDGVDRVAYVCAQGMCGTSGGFAMIMSTNAPRSKKSFARLISVIQPARPPIYELKFMHHGRHDLGVYVVGGGITRPYTSRLTFNGTSYMPTNPTLAGGEKVSARSAMLALISLKSARGGCLLN